MRTPIGIYIEWRLRCLLRRRYQRADVVQSGYCTAIWGAPRAFGG